MRPEQYVASGHKLVRGWLRPEAADLIAALAAVQAVAGSVGEIGVHHGKLFLLLNLLRRPEEAAVAIDLFDRQDLNIDASGRGDRARFEANLRRISPGREVNIQAADSTTITPEQLLEWSGSSRYRLFSVDGGHTAEITCHDLGVAAAVLAPGGLLILDDYFNEQFPGVSEGTNRFLSAQPPVVAFASAHGKTFFTTPEAADVYRPTITATARARGWAIKDTVFFGQSHVVAWKLPAQERAAALAKQLFRRITSADRYASKRL